MGSCRMSESAGICGFLSVSEIFRHATTSSWNCVPKNPATSDESRSDPMKSSSFPMRSDSRITRAGMSTFSLQ